MGSIPAYSHIVVVVEENHGIDQIIGNPTDAPYINQLANGGALLTNMHGEVHPSQSNYFALYAGSTFGFADDEAHSLSGPTIATILKGAGLTFTGYVDEPGLSDFNHDPWVSFPEGRTVQTNFNTFPALFPNGDYSSLPSVSFVIPGINNDMHDGTVQQGDTWLQANLGAYAQWATTHNSLLIVTWDESDSDEEGDTNQIPTFFYGAHVAPGTYSTSYNHYNLLSTILGSFGLTGPNNAATADPIQVFGGRVISTSVSGPITPAAADNPLTITATGAVSSSGAGVDGIDGAASLPVTINTDGSVTASGGTGIRLLGGGLVVNGANNTAASIRGGTYGVYLRAAGSVTNAGTVTGQASNGIVFAGGGSLSNASSGLITGGASGVLAVGAPVTVDNKGTIKGGSTSGYALALTGGGTVTNAGTLSGQDGVGFRSGGSLTNAASGIVTGVATNGVGAFMAGSPGSLTNLGTITGNGVGALLTAGGTIANAGQALLSGASAGLLVRGASGTVTNGATITATATTGTGIDLEMGGSVSNTAAGQVKGGGAGLFATGGSASVTNAGAVSASAGIGLLLAAGGSVGNSGTVSGTKAGVFTVGGTGTLTNSGMVKGTAAGSTGVDLEGGGTIGNTGTIQGQGFGAFLTGGAASLTNAGAIAGAVGVGLGSGQVANNVGGTIVGSSAGVIAGGAATLTNAGGISATASTGAAVDVEGGGTVTNMAGGTIAGGAFGIYGTGGSITLTNGGVITGSSYAVHLGANAANRVVVTPGAVFNGAVDGGGGTLELAKGSGALSGLGSSAFANFKALVVDPGASWTLNGTNTIASMTNNGSIAVGGSLAVGTALDPGSTGQFILGDGAKLELNAASLSQGAIRFAASSSLIVDNAATFGTGVGSAGYSGPELQFFGAGDAIDLKTFSSANVSMTFNAASGLLQLANAGAQTVSLHFQVSSLGSGAFHLASDGAAGLLLTHA